MSFDSLGLAPELLRALSELGYAQPTPIQQQSIPLVLQGRDLLAGAQTGTGKTAAFSLPLLHLMARGESRRGPRAPRALILTPTRELALQVFENLRGYGKYVRLSSATIFGGVSMNPQIDAIRRGLDVIVATPGRLLDHLSQRSVDLSKIEYLILDEADRMLDMGFLPSIQRVLAALPKQRQTLLFSATFAPEIEALAKQFMREPMRVQVAPQNSVVASIEHRAHPVDASKKRDLLMHLIAADSRKQTLVFTRTKHGANRLAEHLEQFGVRAAAIHGNKSQNARVKALNEFKNGKCTVLVATDIAARGIDIDDLPLVINYDLPTVSEDYVHRIGRTGRNGRNGEAISLVAPEEGPLLKDIQRLLKQEIPLSQVEGFNPSRPLQMDASLKAARRPNVGGRPQSPSGHRQSTGHKPGGARHARPSANPNAPKHGPRTGSGSANRNGQGARNSASTRRAG